MNKKINPLKNSSIISLTTFKNLKKSISSLSDIIPNNKKTIEPDKEFTTRARQLKERVKSYDHISTLNFIKQNKINENEKLIKEKALKSIESNYEEVKIINRMVLQAKMATVRDRQIEEKNRVKELEKKRNDKINVLCEIERLKEIMRREKEEQKRIQIQKDGGKLIKEQINYNIKMKLQEEENKKKELEENKILRKKQEKEEEKKFLEEKRRGLNLIKEILRENKCFSEEKRMKKLREIEEDKKLIEYKKQKFLEEKKKQEQNEIARREKEKELNKMKEKQEKEIDNKVILDDIILRRAFESAERNARKNERDQMIRKINMRNDLINQNKKLIEYKGLEMCKMAMDEKKDFFRIIEKQEKDIEKEKQHKKMYNEKLREHNKELQKCIKEREEKNKLKIREIIEEGRKIRQNNEKYFDKINRIKNQKIEELKMLNISPRYLVSLRNYKPG